MAIQLTHKDSQRLQKARAAWIGGRAAEAIRLYEKLAPRNPNHPSIITELAQCYAKLKRFSQADVRLQQLIERHSSHGRVMILVGRTYDLMRWTERALDAYRLAIQCSLSSDEEVVEDPLGQSKSVLKFLGVEWDPRVMQFPDHVRTKVVKSPTYRSVAEPIHSRAVGRWQNYAQQMEPCLEILQPFVEEFGYA